MPEIQVLIDVTEQGYTGQRDGWESYPHRAVVTLESDGTVQIMRPGPEQRRLRFEREELMAALEMLDKRA